MENNNWVTIASFVAVLSVMSMSAMAADQHNMNATLQVGNVAPIITGMAVSQASYDPTESGNTTITITVNVTDANGVSDLNDNNAKLYLDDQSPFVTAVSKYTVTCTVLANHSATVREYQCQTNLEFFDPAGTYASNITASDQTTDIWNNTATNAPTFTYTTLVASTVDDTGITFGSITLGVDNQSASENPTTVTNTGNADLLMNVTGANLVGAGTSEIIGAGNFSISLDATPTAEMLLTTGTQQVTVGGVNATATAGVISTEDLYWYVDVPSILTPDTYIGSWTLGTYEG